MAKKSRITLLTASSATALLLVTSGSVFANQTIVPMHTPRYDQLGALIPDPLGTEPAPTATEQSAAVNGNTLTITFSGNLQASNVDFGAFTVQDGSNTDSVFNAAVKGNTLTLTLASAVASGDTVTVGYSPSGWNDLTDANGNKVAAFSNVAVANNSESAQGGSEQAQVASEQSATVNGKTLTIIFSRNLQASNVDFGAFTVQDGSNTDIVFNAAVNGNTVTLTLANAVASSDTVTVGYSPSGWADLTDANGNKITAFSNVAVTNNTEPAQVGTNPTQTVTGTTTAVKLQNATLDGSTLTLTFSGNLQANKVDCNDFTYTLQDGSNTETPLNATVSGNTVTLTLRSAIPSGGAVLVDYNPTGSNDLTDTNGNNVAAISNLIVTNNSKPTPRPKPPVTKKPQIFNGQWRLVGPSVYLTGNVKHTADYSNKINTLTAYQGVLYAGTQDGVYSFGKGAWHNVGSSRYLNTGSLLGASGTLFATFAYHGVAVYYQGEWRQAGKSGNLNAGSLAVYGNNLYTATDKGVYSLQNNGSWSVVGPSSKLTWAGALTDLNGQLYTAATKDDGSGVFSYHNGSWQSVGQIGSYFNPVSVHSIVRYDNDLYVATDNGVYSKAPSSVNLAYVGHWNDAGLDHTNVGMLLIVNGVMYAATEHGVLAYSNGSWQQVGSSPLNKGNLPTESVSSLAYFNGVLYAGTESGVYAYSSVSNEKNSYTNTTTAITEQSVSVTGKTLTVTFSGNLKTKILNRSAFIVKDEGKTDRALSAKASGDKVMLTLVSAVSSGDTVTVGYDPKEANNLIGANGSQVSGFSNVAVTNNTQSSGQNSSGGDGVALQNYDIDGLGNSWGDYTDSNGY